MLLQKLTIVGCASEVTLEGLKVGSDNDKDEGDVLNVLYERAELATYEHLFDHILSVMFQNMAIMPVIPKLGASFSRQEQFSKASIKKTIRRMLESEFLESIPIS